LNFRSNKKVYVQVYAQEYAQVLYCIVLYCIVLYCIVLYCIVLYCTCTRIKATGSRSECFVCIKIILLWVFQDEKRARFSININLIYFMAIYEDINMTLQIRGKP